MALLKTVLVLLACCDFVFSKRYCEQDSDCDVIGDLTCQKSLCDKWGICGCPRGQASRFVGSSLKFQCITLKKIGESCSTDGTEGLCGADESECVDGKCACKVNHISIWDGERCVQTPVSFGSETCSDSVGKCDGGMDCRGFDWWGSTSNSPFEGVPNACACPDGTETRIPNEYSISHFVGKRKPQCAKIPIGGRCMRNSECGTDATCDDKFECSCTGNNIPSSDNTECGAYKKFNEDCNTDAECTYGTRCGDVCDIKTYLSAAQKKCVCAPGFTGASCGSAVIEGSICYGDAGCKSIGYDALCLDGVCHSGATMMSTGVTSILLVTLSLLMF